MLIKVQLDATVCRHLLTVCRHLFSVTSLSDVTENVYILLHRVGPLLTLNHDARNRVFKIKMLLFHIYMRLNMFRTTHRPSSGA